MFHDIGQTSTLANLMTILLEEQKTDPLLTAHDIYIRAEFNGRFTFAVADEQTREENRLKRATYAERQAFIDGIPVGYEAVIQYIDAHGKDLRDEEGQRQPLLHIRKNDSGPHPHLHSRLTTTCNRPADPLKRPEQVLAYPICPDCQRSFGSKPPDDTLAPTIAHRRTLQ